MGTSQKSLTINRIIREVNVMAMWIKRKFGPENGLPMLNGKRVGSQAWVEVTNAQGEKIRRVSNLFFISDTNPGDSKAPPKAKVPKVVEEVVVPEAVAPEVVEEEDDEDDDEEEDDEENVDLQDMTKREIIAHGISIGLENLNMSMSKTDLIRKVQA